MVTVTLDEVMVNAITGALDVRVAQLSEALGRLQRTRANLKAREYRDESLLRSNEFAIAATGDAIRHAIAATLLIARALDDPEYLPEMTLSQLDEWTTGELVVGYGK